MLRSRRALGLAVAAVFASLTGVSAGQSVSYWKEGVSGNFSDPLRWTGPVPNTFAVDAVINAPGSYVIQSGTSGILRAGSITVDNPGARLQINDVQTERGLRIINGDAWFDFVRGHSLVNEGDGSVWVGSPTGTGAGLEVNELGGKLSMRTTIWGRGPTLQPGTILTSPQLGIRINPFLGTSQGFFGSGTIVLTDAGVIGAEFGGAGPIEIGPDIKIQMGTPTHKESSAISLRNVNFYGEVNYNSAPRVPGQNRDPGGQSDFSGTNFGRIVATDQPAISSFNGINEGLIDISAKVGQSAGLGFGGDNKGTALFTRIGVTIGTNFQNRPGATFRITDGALGIPASAELSWSQIASIERVRSSIEVRGTLNLEGTELIVDPDHPLELKGAIRNGTLSGTSSAAIVTAVGLTPPSLNNMVVNLDLTAPYGLRVVNGLTNQGTVRFGNSARNLLLEGTQTIDGTGTIEILGSSTRSGAGVVLSEGSHATLGPSQTLIASGNYSLLGRTKSSSSDEPVASTHFTNEGTIVATGGTSLAINLATFENKGLIRLQGGSTLLLPYGHLAQIGDLTREADTTVRLNGTGTFTGQTIDLSASPAGPLDFGSLAYQGGRFVSPGRAVSVSLTSDAVFNTRLTDAVLAADVEVGSAATLTLNNTPLDGATVTLRPNSTLVAASMMGTGIIQVDGAAKIGTNDLGPGVAVNVAKSGTLTLTQVGSPTTIRLGGPLTVNGGAATIDQIVPAMPLSLESSATARMGGTLTFARPLTIAAGAKLSVTDANTVLRIQLGLTNAGTLELAPGTIFEPYGTIAGNPVSIEGTLRPGGGGRTSVSFSTAPQLFDSTRIELQLGPTATSPDQLMIAGPLTAAGNLIVDVENAWPVPGRSVTLLSYQSLTGAFNEFEVRNVLPGYAAAINIEPTRLSLTLNAKYQGDANVDAAVNLSDLAIVGTYYAETFPFQRTWFEGDFTGDQRVDLADLKILSTNWQDTDEAWYSGLMLYNLPLVPVHYQVGDYNLDGVVDVADYTVWADNFGRSGRNIPGDGNNSGRVDAADYTVWADNFGRGTPLPSAIPEPTSAALVLGCGALVLGRRKR